LAAPVEQPARIGSLAAGNILAAEPVATVSVAAEAAALAARLPAAWQDARRLLPRPDEIAPPTPPAEGGAAALVATLAQGLRRLAGLAPGRRLRLRSQDGVQLAAIAAPEEAASVAALRLAAGLLLPRAAGSPLPPPLRDQVATLRREAWLREGTWASAVATRLGIPWRIAIASTNPIVILGQGRCRQIFWRHMAGSSGHLGTMLTDDKRRSSELLRRAGLPAPPQQEVRSAEEAVAAAEAMGWPVVVKPATSGGGNGVTAGITNREALLAAFALARPVGPVVVEKHIHGDHHRVFLHRGRFISAQRFIPGHVVGDGRRTVTELLEAVNATRTEQLSASWKKIPLDDTARMLLQRQGLTPHSVPAEGQHVPLRSQSNLSSGGTFEILTDRTHPDNRRVCEAAARLFDQEIVGLDFITPDISRSWIEVGGGINELNKNASYLLGGEEPDWADRFIGDWFPAPARGRIPIAIVLGGAEAAPLAEALAALLHPVAEEVAVVSADAVRFGPVRSRGPAPLRDQVEAALYDPMAAAMVILAAPGDLRRGGLGLDRAELALVAPGAADRDGAAIAAVARLAPRLVLPPGVAAPDHGAVQVAASAEVASLVAAAAAAMRPLDSPREHP
jgi:cyanophycin synthetase